MENGPTAWTNALLIGSQAVEQDPKAHGPGSESLPGAPEATTPGGDSSLHGPGQLGWHQEQLMRSQAPENQSPSCEEEQAGPGVGVGARRGAMVLNFNSF